MLLIFDSFYHIKSHGVLKVSGFPDMAFGGNEVVPKEQKITAAARLSCHTSIDLACNYTMSADGLRKN